MAYWLCQAEGEIKCLSALLTLRGGKPQSLVDSPRVMQGLITNSNYTEALFQAGNNILPRCSGIVSSTLQDDAMRICYRIPSDFTHWCWNKRSQICSLWSSIGLDNGLVVNRWQVIIWSNDRHKDMLLSLDESKNSTSLLRCHLMSTQRYIEEEWKFDFQFLITYRILVVKTRVPE